MFPRSVVTLTRDTDSDLCVHAHSVAPPPELNYKSVTANFFPLKWMNFSTSVQAHKRKLPPFYNKVFLRIYCLISLFTSLFEVFSRRRGPVGVRQLVLVIFHLGWFEWEGSHPSLLRGLAAEEENAKNFSSVPPDECRVSAPRRLGGLTRNAVVLRFRSKD